MRVRFPKSRLFAFAAVVELSIGLTGNVSSIYADEAKPIHADNSKVNVRDRKDAEVTTGDQPSSGSDLKLTQQIRRAVTDDSSLSTNAHNVKIITLGGTVTLKGPVESEAEKEKVISIAKKFAGNEKVRSEIGIAKQ